MSVQQVSPAICFEAVRNRSRPVALLIGAGCSKSAGIKLASEFVLVIEEKYQHLCRLRAKSRDYAEIAGLLTEDQWIELFWDEVRDARVNLAHLCIGELVKQGIVDRVLTTNFDSLIARGCLLADAPVAVCDCVAMPDVHRALDDRRPAVYHLHGQAHGMGMLNSRRDRRARFVQRIVRQTIYRRILIVCGYSGTCDGVLNCLRDEASLRNPVFWVPFDKSDVATVDLQFRQGQKDHFYVLENYGAGRGADRFFFELLREIGGTLPPIVTNRRKFNAGLIQRVTLPRDFKKWLAGSQPQTPLAADPLAILTPKTAPPKWT